MSIWWALFFMGLGGAVVGFFNALAWRKYYEGKREWQNCKREVRGVEHVQRKIQ